MHLLVGLHAERYAAEMKSATMAGVDHPRSNAAQNQRLEVCQRLRHAGVETPVIMLTARGAASDAAFGLKLGADDYIPKPFDVGELLARVEAVLRRAKHHARRAGSCLDRRRNPLSTTPQGDEERQAPRSQSAEFELLQFLIAHAGETVTREQLLHHIWGEHASLYTRTIDAHITRLRHKHEADRRTRSI
jgi:DNA-binding response OmpR family regulator